MQYITHRNGNISVITISDTAQPLVEDSIHSVLVLDSTEKIDPYTHYVKDNEIYEYTLEQTASKLKFPLDLFNSVWDNDLMQYVDIRSLEQYRIDTYNKFKQEYEVLNNSNIRYLGWELQADEKSKEALFKQFQISQGNGKYEIEWILANNNTAIFTAINIKEIVLAIDERTQKLKQKLQQLRVQTQTASKELLAELKLEI